MCVPRIVGISTIWASSQSTMLTCRVSRLAIRISSGHRKKTIFVKHYGRIFIFITEIQKLAISCPESGNFFFKRFKIVYNFSQKSELLYNCVNKNQTLYNSTRF